MSFLSNARDKAVELFINRSDLVKRFGEIRKVAIDPQNNCADITILLHGEENETKLKAYYFFEDTPRGTEIVFNKVTSDRIMIAEGADWWFQNHTLRRELPKAAGLFAKILF